MKDLEEQRVCVCVWNFASNSGKLLLKRGKCFNKPSEMNIWAERSVLNGTVVSKQEERWLIKFPEVDDLPVNRRRSHRCSSRFVSPKSPFDYQRDCWRCRHQLWITPSNYDRKTLHRVAAKFVPCVLIKDQKQTKLTSVNYCLTVSASIKTYWKPS